MLIAIRRYVMAESLRLHGVSYLDLYMLHSGKS